MGLILHQDRSVRPTRSLLEYEVARRISAHARGVPGISRGHATGDGTHEMVLRDEQGIPVGVMGFTGREITDYCVLAGLRRLGIATRLYRFLAESGVKHIRGPFTEAGLAFAQKMTGGA